MYIQLDMKLHILYLYRSVHRNLWNTYNRVLAKVLKGLNLRLFFYLRSEKFLKKIWINIIACC